MTMLSDTKLKELNVLIIAPFATEQVKQLGDEGVISWGVSSYGYDVRVADEYRVFHNANMSVIDPKNFDPDAFIEVSGQGFCLVPPNSFVLCRTVEWVRVPNDCLARVAAKSTYARCGLVVNSTVLEPGWEGHVTLELSNTTPLPIKVYSNEGITQLIFDRGEPCEVDYATRNGKYQGQVGITLPKV